MNSPLLTALILTCAAVPVVRAQEAPVYGALLRSAGPAPDMGTPFMGPARPVEPSGTSAGSGGVDLSGQFPTSSRDQLDVGSCHTFTAVGLLEAAYYRKYGERIRFSEADLFMQYRLLSGNAYDSWVWRTKPELGEGGRVQGDIETAIARGVATTPQYSDFVERYRRYREAEQRTLQNIEEQRKKDPWYVRLLYDPRRHWRRMQQDPQAQRILQNYLMGNDRTLESQRETTRQKLQGFKVDRQFFITLPNSVDRPKEQCRRDGRSRTQAVLKELDAGRPVGVSYFTDNDWGSHVIIVTGYKTDETGGIVFKTRNSWGAGGDFNMCPDDMCKVHQLASVRP
ncbi:MAG: hypothetical protein WC728_04165 [Elusimicrobiota bacterium]